MIQTTYIYGSSKTVSLTRCVPTGWKAGVVEFVEDASTLGEIHTQGGGVTGSFEANILLTWLRK